MKISKDLQITEDSVSSIFTKDDDTSSIEDNATFNKDLDTLSGKELTFNHADFPWRGIVIEEQDKQIYYANVSALSLNKPDIVLHRHCELGQIVGQAHFRWSLSIKAGVGPDDTAMQWTNMKRGGVVSRHYTFEWEGRTYSLRRTHSGKSGLAGHQKAMFSHMKIVSDETRELVAVYTSTISIGRRRGSIRYAGGVSPELEILCILGFAAWREKISRAGGRSSGAVGGGY